ncbi:hypothetical protein OAO87_04325 [bacterium]|nr:hypothetical protein [bacterium]
MPQATNYDVSAAHSNDACIYPIAGCMDSANLYFMPAANTHNASACALCATLFRPRTSALRCGLVRCSWLYYATEDT